MWLRHWQRRLGGVTLTTIKSPVPWKMFTAAGSGQGSCIPALAGRIGTGSGDIMGALIHFTDI